MSDAATETATETTETTEVVESDQSATEQTSAEETKTETAGADESVSSDKKEESEEQGDKAVEDGKSGVLELKEKVEITLPEGAVLEPEFAEALTGLAEEHGLTSDAASAIAALDVERSAKAREMVSDQNKQWAKELSEDKEFGGKQLDATKADAVRFLHAYGGKEAYEVLEEMGVGSLPPLIKLFARAGQALKEDDSSVGTGGKQASVEPTPDQRLAARYPTMYGGSASE